MPLAPKGAPAVSREPSSIPARGAGLLVSGFFCLNTFFPSFGSPQLGIRIAEGKRTI